MSDLDGAIRLAIAALVGLGVGVEREWSVHASARPPRFAGLRTFLMLGLIGGCAGLLVDHGQTAIGAIVIAGGMAISVAAYVASAGRSADLDGTTEVAALIVVTLGAFAGVGMLALASGTGAIVVLALHEKQRLHGAVRVVREEELRAALRFSVLALVVLPLLPAGPLGPLAIRPRSLWMIVLLFCALNFAAFIARRVAGARHGYGLVGMLGGLISSTAVTLDFSRRSRREPALAASLASGVIGACTVLIPRVLVVSAVLNAAVALELLPYLAPAALVGAWIVVRDWRSSDAGDGAAESPPGNPLRLWMAVRMALLFQVALTAIDFARSVWTTPGLYATAAALGLTDVDALTVAMSRPSLPMPADLAARAIAVGILGNTALKIALSLSLG
ncbi:MAG: MgtC/SapB family protein, partial [Gemmatimonadaceae bacterium]